MAQTFWETSQTNFDKQLFKEYNKTTKDLDEYVEILKKWVETQPHLPEVPYINGIRFALLSNKFSIEKAKMVIDMYYSIKNMMPELFCKHPLSPEMILTSKVAYFIPLPKVTDDYKRILFLQINPNYGPELFNHENFLVHIINVIELLIQEDNCFDFHFVADCSGVKMSHVPKFSLTVLKKTAVILEKVYSNRVASLTITNSHTYLEHFLNNIVKPGLNPKLRDRLNICSGADGVLQKFGKAVMPSDIGGEERSLAELNDMLIKKFEDHKDRFDKIQFMRVNESLRPTKLVNDEVLGYYGNFKKIDID